IARSYICLSYKNMFAANGYALADSAIKYASLAQQTNTENPTVKVTGPPINGQINYWGPGRGNFNTYRQGSYVARLMNGDDTTCFAGITDPRCWYMLSENLNGTFKGLLPWSGNSTMSNDYPKSFWRYAPQTVVGTAPNAVTYPIYPPSVATPPTSWNDSCRYLYDNTSPWPMMTASEMQFIIAEAQFRKGNKGAALTAYTNAISLNFDMLTTQYPKGVPAGKQITPAVKAAYLANPVIVPSSANLTLTHIMNQKYIALFVWGALETWVDMRKFHYIDIDPSTGKKVYAGFTPPAGANLVSTNLGQYTYRMRPRFNSEYLYNIPELTRVGAYQFPEYNTFKNWFALP
ncbi:MAG TPA: SusD/RagB family nutrient-binding outer membrane lipoprotein, partial [Chitinophagaceae bacterium]|nr:SusD/RagB family nutrient-binding outer membrane lipoprotein [Chitinophagaceae bacterium]